MSIVDFPESLSQQVFVGIILVGRLGVLRLWKLNPQTGSPTNHSKTRTTRRR